MVCSSVYSNPRIQPHIQLYPSTSYAHLYIARVHIAGMLGPMLFVQSQLPLHSSLGVPSSCWALLVHTIRSNRHATVFESTVYRWIKSPSGLPVSSIRSSDTFRELHIRATPISSGSFMSGTYLDLEEWRPGVARPGVVRPV